MQLIATTLLRAAKVGDILIHRDIVCSYQYVPMCGPATFPVFTILQVVFRFSYFSCSELVFDMDFVFTQ